MVGRFLFSNAQVIGMFTVKCVKYERRRVWRRPNTFAYCEFQGRSSILELLVQVGRVTMGDSEHYSSYCSLFF